jgi:hypothetical protein
VRAGKHVLIPSPRRNSGVIVCRPRIGAGIRNVLSRGGLACKQIAVNGHRKIYSYNRVYQIEPYNTVGYNRGHK